MRRGPAPDSGVFKRPLPKTSATLFKAKAGISGQAAARSVPGGPSSRWTLKSQLVLQ